MRTLVQTVDLGPVVLEIFLVMRSCGGPSAAYTLQRRLRLQNGSLSAPLVYGRRQFHSVEEAEECGRHWCASAKREAG